MEIGAADDPGAGGPGAGQAGGVGARGDGLIGHGPTAGRGGDALHVDEVLDGQPDAGTRRVEPGDEGGHGERFQR